MNLGLQKKLIHLFKKRFAPSNITPQNDFYTFINYNWLKNTDTNIKNISISQKYYTQIDDFRVVQDKVYNHVIEIVEDYINKTNKTKKAQQLKNVYHSLLNLDEKESFKQISIMVENYNKHTQQDDANLWKYMAYINHNEIVCWACPIYCGVMPDEKHSKKFINYISIPELSLYNVDLYLDDKGQTTKFIKYKKLVKSKYFKYINDIFDACLDKGHNLKAHDVFDVECELLTAMDCNSIKNDAQNMYNIVSADEALEKYGFDWIQFAKILGYKTTPKTFICDSLNYLKCVCKLLSDNWKTQKWKSYWIYIYLRQMIRFNKKLVLIYYEFNGKFLHGQQEQFPWNIYPVFGLSITFNSLLTTEGLLRNKYKYEKYVNYVENMSKDLLTVFKRIIKRNTWMSPKTKKYALLKLKYLKFIIAKPPNLMDDPLLDYSPTDAWGNMLQITNWRANKYIELNGHEVIDIPMVNWNAFKLIGQQSYIVNAFYTPSLNSIYIPLAYLQKPFLDLEERGIEYNLVHIGFTIAHEMSHCLDDVGSKYGYDGNLHDWVSEIDKKKCDAIKDDIIKQYEVFAANDGIIFDARESIGEDLADISGISICQEYLSDFQDKNEDIIPIRGLSFQAFYVYFAMQQRQHIYKQAVSAQLIQNPHPINKYRCNVPLSRLELFRSIYNIKKGDKMWWHSTNTVW